MNVLRHSDKAFADKLRALTMQSSLFDPTIEERTRAILQDVHTRGDAALLELTERFDGAKLTTDQLAVTKAELLAASVRADEGLRAPLVSTALMTVTLAKVAGCPEIVVCTPCGRDGSINPALLYAARSAGAMEIYRAGGAQAVAAMAYGTATIPRVQKIFGPGNAYVVA